MDHLLYALKKVKNNQQLCSTAMKFARVRPLFKKNSKSDFGNYRPVSILSIVSKNLEKAVYNQLKEHLSKKKWIYSLQSGFKGSYSTVALPSGPETICPLLTVQMNYPQ